MVARLRSARAANAVANRSLRVGASLGQDRVRQESFRFTAPVGGIADLPYSRREATPYARVLKNFWPTVNGLVPRRGAAVAFAVGPESTDSTINFMLDVEGDVLIHAMSGSTSGSWYARPPSQGSGLARSASGLAEQNSMNVSAVAHRGGSTRYAIIVGGGIVNDNNPKALLAYRQVSHSALNVMKFGEDDLGIDVTLNYPSGTQFNGSFSYVFKFSNRTFYLKSGSLEAYYTAAGAGWGDLSKLDLSGVVSRGGSLMFGATWTYDAGDGLNDRCLLFTDQGEVASYVGDPSSSDFTLEGVYYLGKPLNPHAHFQMRGDLFVMTRDGLASIAALVGATESMGVPMHSAHLAEEYRRVVRAYPAHEWRCAVWPSQAMAVLSHPKGWTWLVNMDLNSWCTYRYAEGVTKVTYTNEVTYYSRNVTLVENGAAVPSPDTGVYLVRTGSNGNLVKVSGSDAILKDFIPAQGGAPAKLILDISTQAQAVWISYPQLRVCYASGSFGEVVAVFATQAAPNSFGNYAVTYEHPDAAVGKVPKGFVPCTSDDRLYLGSDLYGTVLEAWVGGADELVFKLDGESTVRVVDDSYSIGYDCECRMVPSDLGDGTDFKYPASMTSIWNVDVDLEVHHGILPDLKSPLPPEVVGTGVTALSAGSPWGSPWRGSDGEPVTRWSDVTYPTDFNKRSSTIENARGWTDSDASTLVPYVHTYCRQGVPVEAKFLFLDLIYQVHQHTVHPNEEAVGAS